MPAINCTITLDPVTVKIETEEILEFLSIGENYTHDQLTSANDETLLSYLQEEGLEEFIIEYGIDAYATPIMISLATEEEPAE